MAQTIGQHPISTFTSPTNGDALDATVVKSNDNTIRDAYVAHDADSGIHVQSSLLSARPVAGVAGRKWMTTDTGTVKIWFDTGATWEQIGYVPTGDLTTNLLPSVTNTYDLGSSAKQWKDVYAQTATVANTLTVDTTTLVVDGATNRVGIGTASPTALLDVVGAASVRSVEFDGTTSGTVTVQPAATAGTWSLTLPTTAGSNGYLLQTNGSGVTQWADASGFADTAITPTLASPYDVIASDASKRFVMNSTSTGAIQLLAANTSGIPTNGRIRVASLGAGTFLYVQGVPDTLATVINGNVNAIAQQSDGKILIVGAFTLAGGSTRNRIARLNTDGTLDTGYDPNANGTISAIAIQSDGKAIVGGNFTTVGGTARNRIARINTDGTLDTGYNPDAAAGVKTIVIQSSDGKAIVGGDFTTIVGTSRNRIARLNTDGTLDTGYDPNANNSVNGIAIQSDGKALVGGAFTTIVATARNRIARINTDGTLDTGYNPNANAAVRVFKIQSDGKAIVGGDFTTMGGTARGYGARLNTDGTLDTGFADPVLSGGTVYATEVQSDGSVVFGGDFTTASGITRNRIARVTSAGVLDLPYNPNCSGLVNALLIQANASLLVGHSGLTISGLSRAYLGRLFGTANDNVAAPYTTQWNVPQYSVLTLEKIATSEWLITESNVS